MSIARVILAFCAMRSHIAPLQPTLHWSMDQCSTGYCTSPAITRLGNSTRVPPSFSSMQDLLTFGPPG